MVIIIRAPIACARAGSIMPMHAKAAAVVMMEDGVNDMTAAV